MELESAAGSCMQPLAYNLVALVWAMENNTEV